MNNTLVASSTKRRRGELGDQFGVDRRLGGEVEVGQGEGGGQRGEAGQAGPAALLDGVDLDGQQPLQERRSWLSLVLAASSSRPGRASAAAAMRKKARCERSFW